MSGHAIAPYLPAAPDRIPDLWAVRPKHRIPDWPAYATVRHPEDDVGLTRPAGTALRNDGWILVEAADDRVAEIMATDFADHVAEVVRVYRDPLFADEPLLGTRRIMVLLRPTGRADRSVRILGESGVQLIRRYAWNPWALAIRVQDPAADPFSVSLDLADEHAELLRFAMPELRHRIQARDAFFEAQWHLHGRHPAASDCLSTAHIRAEDAWEVTKGVGIKIGIVDQAFDYDHPNLGEDAILNTSAFLNDLGPNEFGWDKVRPTTLMAHRHHGTGCAGIAAARPIPTQGLSGSAPSAKLLLVAMNALGTPQDLADAIVYAADPSTQNPAAHWTDGADVISCSLYPRPAASGLPPAGGSGPVFSVDPILDAVKMVAKRGRACRGCPVFWAVSNHGDDVVSDDPVASSKHVMAVGRTDCHDSHPTIGEHAYGPGLDFVAPGVGVVTLKPDGGWADKNGTSYATALAAGVGALVLATNPDLTARQVRRILRRTCNKVGPDANYHPPLGPRGWDEHYGFGRINARKAVLKAQAML
jgi:thermitase